MASSGIGGYPNQESIAQIRKIVEEFAVLAERREEASQQILKGQPVDQSAFVGPQVVMLNAAPGLGKTVALVKVAEQLWDSLPVLHLGPTHDSFENVDRLHGLKSPNGYGWHHWQGHDDGRHTGTPCPRAVRASKGYVSGDECGENCNATAPMFLNAPTFAPVDYILSTHLPDFPLDWVQLIYPTPLAEEAVNYPWWAIDDVGLDRFVGKLEVTVRDLELTTAHYPAEWPGADTIRTLARGFLMVMANHRARNEGQPQPNQESWYGLPLYVHLDAALRNLGHSVGQMTMELPAIELSNEPWPGTDEDPNDWPTNFMPQFKPKLQNEMAACVLTQFSAEEVNFHPFVHVVWATPEAGGPLQSILRIRWHRRPSLLRPILLLDATGDRDLLERAFRVFPAMLEEGKQIDTPSFPADIRVFQFWGNHITRGTLLSNPEKIGWKRKIVPLYRKLLIQELTRCRASWSGSQPPKVGLITFKSLVEDAQEALGEAGFASNDQTIDYYYNVRGSNSFTECDFVVIMGYPIPNPQGLFEEACVLYFNDKELLRRDQKTFELSIQLRKGQVLPVSNIPGYEDSRMQSLYRQKSVSELYQV